MSSVENGESLHSGLGIVPEALHPVPGMAVATSVAVVQGPVSYVALGTTITELRRYVQKVVLLYDGGDPRVLPLAATLDVEVVDLSRAVRPAVDLLVATGSEPGFIVILPGDGSQDASCIPLLLEYVRHGYDLVEASDDFGTGRASETVLFLNNKVPRRGNPRLLACSRECLEHLSPEALIHGQSLLSEQVCATASRAGLKIKRLELGSRFQSFLGAHRIGVVVPAYNEQLLIEETLSGIPAYVTRIYVVDDCSTDRTPEILRKNRDPRIVAVRHGINKGVGAAIITGYKLALEDELDIVAVMAGDNQMDPAELPRLLLPIMEGRADYTKGNRLLSKSSRKGMSRWRTFGNSLLTMINKIGSGYWDIMDPQNGYTAISRQALEALDLDTVYTYYGYCNDLLIKLNTFGLRTQDVVMPARYGRETSKIRYSRFILKVAPMIFRGFLWRLKTKYMTLRFHPLVLFYIAGMTLAPLGVVSCLLVALARVLLGPMSAVYPLLAAFVTITGFELLFFAMLFDAQENKSLTSG